MRFWLGVASADHAFGGRDGGFAQLGHGKHNAVASLKKGDWVIYYSPRTDLGRGETVQAFTTIGQVISDAPYRAAQAMDFHPYRVDVDYLTDARPAPIRPLLDRLKFTKGHGTNWGLAVRGSKRRLDAGDARLIAEAMGVPDRILDFINQTIRVRGRSMANLTFILANSLSYTTNIF